MQYGKRIAAFVLYLLHYQLLPEKRLAALMADLFGVKLATATIARLSQDCAGRLRGFADAVRDSVAAAPVKHIDETGFRISGKTQWRSDDTSLRIGAMARMSDIATHRAVREGWPVISEALLASASPQVRNMGTLGGNLLQRTRCGYFRDTG